MTAHFFCIILFIMLILQLDFNAILYFRCECSYCQLHKIYLCEIHRASLCLYNKGQDLENIAIIPSDETKNNVLISLVGVFVGMYIITCYMFIVMDVWLCVSQLFKPGRKFSSPE